MIGNYAMAQDANSFLTGRVTTPAGSPLSECIVQLADTIHADGNHYGLAETDSAGCFRVRADFSVNRLLVSRLGYNATAVPVLPGKTHYEIVLAENADMQLEEVSMIANRKVVNIKPSGIEYNMQNSPVRGGGLLNALRFVPLLNVSSAGDVSVMGKSGSVAYYVDGRKLRLTGNALAAYLQALRAEDVKAVEVLTLPDRRFHEPAENSVINIITKQSEHEGVKGLLDTQLSQARSFDVNGSLMLTYDRGRLNAQVFASGSLDKNRKEGISIYDYTQLGEQNITDYSEESHTVGYDVRALLSYELTEHSSLSGQVTVSYAPNRQELEAKDYYYEQGGTTPYAVIGNHNKIEIPAKSVAANVEYLNSFGKPNTQLRLVADYYYGNVLSKQDMRMNYLLPDGQTRPYDSYLDESPQKSNVLSGDLRYTFPVGSKATLTVGGSGYSSRIENNDIHRVLTDGVYVEDPLLSHDLLMKEWNASALFQVEGRWNSHWTSSVSYRQMYRNYRSRMNGTGECYKRDFWDPQVDVSVVYTVNNNHVLSYGGYYKTDAPAFNDLNPFRWYVSPTKYTEGNPYLVPLKSLFHGIRYLFFQKFMAGANHYYIGDGVSYYECVNSDGMIVVSPENMLTQQGFNAYVGASGLSYAKERGNVSLTLVVMNNWYENDLHGEVWNTSKFGYAAFANHFFMLWPAERLQMVNSVSFQSESESGLWRTPATMSFYTEIQKQEGNWTFSLSGFVNPYIYDRKMSLKEKMDYRSPTLMRGGWNKGEPYGCALRISYTFGNQKVRDVRRSESTNSEVRSRLK